MGDRLICDKGIPSGFEVKRDIKEVGRFGVDFNSDLQPIALHGAREVLSSRI